MSKQVRWDESADWSKPRRKRTRAKCPFCGTRMEQDRRVMTCPRCKSELPIQREA